MRAIIKSNVKHHDLLIHPSDLAEWRLCLTVADADRSMSQEFHAAQVEEIVTVCQLWLKQMGVAKHDKA